MAFSSGILISAVCFELLFEAYSYGNIYTTTIGFVFGVVLFTVMDSIIHKFSIGRYKNDYTNSIEEYKTDYHIDGRKNEYNGDFDDINDYNIIKHKYTRYFNKYQVQSLTTIIGVLLDGIPEAIAIGLTYFIGGPISIALLAAVFISNSFEGVSASLNMRLGGWVGKDILGIWILVFALTSISAMSSYIIFSHTDKHILSGALAIAAGAILAMIADTMLPESYNEMQEWTGFLMSMGFLVSFILSHLTSH